MEGRDLVFFKAGDGSLGTSEIRGPGFAVPFERGIQIARHALAVLIAHAELIERSRGSEWNVRAIGDFSGDGKDDIVLFHGESGTTVKFENGLAENWTNLGQLDANDWFIVGAGDYNGDRKEDLLVRQYSTGMLGYYENGDMSKWVELGRGVDMNWTVVA